MPPAWATELNAVEDKVNALEKLSADYQNLKLDDDFLAKVKTEMARFAKEIEFRRNQAE